MCTLDYRKMGKVAEELVEYMQPEPVRITAPGTDLTFSIKDIPVIPCSGQSNIPDGEVLQHCPVLSMERFATMRRALIRGLCWECSLTFENGKIIKAEANDTERINGIFDMDRGARYVGGCHRGESVYPASNEGYPV